MAMTDIYRPTHPLITIQLYQGISAVNLVWEEPLTVATLQSQQFTPATTALEDQ